MNTNNALIMFILSVDLVITDRQNIYSGYTVHDVWLRNAAEQKLLLDLQLKMDVDIWQHGVPGVRVARVMIAPENRDFFLRQLASKGIDYILRIADVAKSLEEFDASLSSFRSHSYKKYQPFEDYLRYAEVIKYLEQIAAKFPHIVTLASAGRSFEGRDIKYLKISNTKFSNRDKPVYFITALLHAREWISLPVALYCIHRLVENLKSEDRDLLEGTDWLILPIANPDGYEYTHTHVKPPVATNPFIRNKDSSKCVGVDANRNFDANFNTFGVSSNPCSPNYPGPWAFSEPESGAIRTILHEFSDRIQVYLDLHSFGDCVLYGFGNYTLPKNDKQIELVGRTMAAEMNAVQPRKSVNYLSGNIANLMYPISGSATDYAIERGIPLPLTIELPGFGHEFLVPPRYLAHNNAQVRRAVAVSARLAKTYRNKAISSLKKPDSQLYNITIEGISSRDIGPVLQSLAGSLSHSGKLKVNLKRLLDKIRFTSQKEKDFSDV